MVGGGKMTTIIIASIIALPLTWIVSKLYDYYTSKEIVFEIEDEEADR